ncbi:MAG TPA: OmpH family outer membrane protein [Luteolibacter sp.]|nr:OmpH family outer membrane protein [Luteolibacter sp.]
MLRASASLIAFAFLLSLPISAAPKFATVKISEIYRNLVSTKKLTADLELERQAILKDERAEHLRRMLAELKSLYEELQKKRGVATDDETRKLAQAFEQKRQESQTLQQEFQLFETEKKKEINSKMVTSMRASLEKIAAASRKVAQEKGFDGAFDVSGNSNTGVPVILFVKNDNDITEEVVAALKDAGEPTTPAISDSPAAPTPEAPAPAPAPAPAKP